MAADTQKAQVSKQHTKHHTDDAECLLKHELAALLGLNQTEGTATTQLRERQRQRHRERESEGERERGRERKKRENS